MTRTASRAASCFIVAGSLLVVLPSAAPAAPPQGASPGGASSGLPLPSSDPLNDYERSLYKFLFKRAYAASPYSWTHDQEIRDTGPFVGGMYYGTHPAVRVYYSPEVMSWLNGGRQGEIADGGMIVKEMFPSPAALYVDPVVGTPPSKDPTTGASPLDGLITAWTVMVKDRKIAKGGWFYANPGAPKIDRTGKTPAEIEKSIDRAVETALDNYDYPFVYPTSGIALGTCQRCHSSAEKEMTFSSLDNILDFPRQPIRFLNDATWRKTELHAALPKEVRSLFAAVAPAGNTDRSPQFASAPSLIRPPQGSIELEDSLKLQRYAMSGLHRPPTRLATRTAAAPGRPAFGPNPAFVATFPIASQTQDPRKFPSQWADHVVAGPKGAESYITSDNCMGCHGGLGGAPYGLAMFVKTGIPYGEGFNLSEYGEWRWSPMGLAGRDPIFHAQLESELALVNNQAPAAKDALTNLCLSCHGAMGQRQLASDAKAGLSAEMTSKSLDPNFKLDYFYLTTALDRDGRNQKDYEYHKYGNLAREGVSCTICHHIDKPDKNKVTSSGLSDIEYFLMKNTTGRYERGPDDVLNGPFEKVAVFPMKASLGITPKQSAYIKDSQLCGTCHAINLPNIDATYPGKNNYLNEAETIPEFKNFPHSLEQATFLEWQNSVFAKQDDAANFKSCQDCHMPGGFVSAEKGIDLPQLVTQVATIEDTNNPMVDNGARADDIHVPVRDNYKRHELVGLNVFVESMFNQFEPILGVSRSDFMTSATNGNNTAMDNMVRQAREKTVGLSVELGDSSTYSRDTIVANVTVTNKVGHRFPSGVGFRRAFLEVLAIQNSTEEVVWASGRTNSVGVIVDGLGRPLRTEFLPDSETYQPHYQSIVAEDQVQIYEELTLNARNEFNTSFLTRDRHPKDNRLLARGWLAGKSLANTKPPTSAIVMQFLAATDPEGESVLRDPDFSDNDGTGATGLDHIQYVMKLPRSVNMADIAVKATIYYQAIPPFFLQQLFKQRDPGDATKRLYYMASRLETKGTPIEDWKLPLVSATVKVTPGPTTRPEARASRESRREND